MRSVSEGAERPAARLEPPEADLSLLDGGVRAELKSLPAVLADIVGRHLIAAGAVFDSDPDRAYQHAAEARRLASRIASTREAAGLTAYRTERYSEAIKELRAWARITGLADHLPTIADCERGLGKPERALDLAASPEAARLDSAGRAELAMVISGARRDLGQFDAAVLALQAPGVLDREEPFAARTHYAYADALLAAGRRDEAINEFQVAEELDVEEETDAADRLGELTGEPSDEPSAEAGSDLEAEVDDESDDSFVDDDAPREADDQFDE